MRNPAQVFRVTAESAVFQGLASIMAPYFIIHTQVSLAELCAEG